MRAYRTFGLRMNVSGRFRVLAMSCRGLEISTVAACELQGFLAGLLKNPER